MAVTEHVLLKRFRNVSLAHIPHIDNYILEIFIHFPYFFAL